MEKDGFYLLSNENYFRKQFHCCSPVLTNESLCLIFVRDVLYKELANTNCCKGTNIATVQSLYSGTARGGIHCAGSPLAPLVLRQKAQ